MPPPSPTTSSQRSSAGQQQLPGLALPRPFRLDMRGIGHGLKHRVGQRQHGAIARGRLREQGRSIAALRPQDGAGVAAARIVPHLEADMRLSLALECEAQAGVDRAEGAGLAGELYEHRSLPR